MKLSLKLFIMAIIIILFSINAQAETSKYQAGKLVEEYLLENEISTTSGPYEYEGNEYFVVKVIPLAQIDLVKAQFVVDREKGEIVQDEDIFYGVSKIDLYVNKIVANDHLTMYRDNMIVIRKDIGYWDDSEVFWNETADIATTTAEKNAAKKAASICGELIVKFEDELEVSQNLTAAIAEILDGSPSDVEVNNYIDLKNQLNSKYEESQKTVVEARENLPGIYDEFTDSNYAYDLKKSEWESYENTDLNELGKLDDNYRVLNIAGQTDSWVQEDLDWAWESMNDRVTSENETSENETSENNTLTALPGFEITGPIAALLILTLLFRRE
ncbi:hypothetical protein ACSAZL_09985 [Methanosarcina sp. T3]|uniref:hypothetical protein n=1 Tax=Methanosarcina sp. T3 TaxID=3439062 RepID=UPI003F824FA9